ncbi:MAG: hypothetical protein ABL994_08140, partial [Verrucomicrobiales bacterium]
MISRLFLLLLSCAIVCCKPALRREGMGDEGLTETPPPTQSHDPGIAENPDPVPVKTTRFPLKRTLHNPQGKAIECEIIAKEGDSIAFRREADGKSFLISVFQLSVDDQLFLADFEDEAVDVITAFRDESGTNVSPGSKDKPADGGRPLLPREILWHETLESALEAAKISGKNVMLVMTGDFDFSPSEFQVELYSESADKNSDSLIRTVLKDTSFLGFVNSQFEAVHNSYFIAKEITGEQHVEMEDLKVRWKLRVLSL